MTTAQTFDNLQQAPAEPRAAVEHVLTLDCQESPGIVHAISGFLLGHGCDIIDSKQYGQRGGGAAGHFFVWVHFASDTAAFTTEELRRDFEP